MADKLHDLINSMTKKEKAYFSRFAKLNVGSKETDYLKLYKVLESVKAYDEENIKSKLNDEKISGNLSSKKGRLTNKILESLALMNTNQNIEIELKQLLNFIIILFHKKQYKELHNQIRIVRKKALKYDAFLVLIEIIDWEKKLLIEQSPKNINDKFDSLIEQENKYIEAVKEIKTLENLLQKIIRLFHKDNQLANLDNQLKFKELVKNPLLKKEEQTLLSTKAKSFYLRIKSIVSRRNGQKQVANDYSEKFVALIENSYLKEDRTLYKLSLCNLLYACYTLKSKKQFDIVNLKLKNLSTPKAKSDREQVSIFNTSCHWGLLFYLNTCQFEKAINEAKQIKENWDLFKGVAEPSRMITDCYNCIMIFWIIGDNSSAANWLLKIFEFSNSKKRQDLLISSRLMQMPIFYDLKPSNLSNYIENTSKWLRSKNANNDFSTIVLKQFRLINKSVDYLEPVKDLQTKLLEIKNANTHSFLGLNEMLLWCKTKISGKSLKTVFMESQRTVNPRD